MTPQQTEALAVLAEYVRETDRLRDIPYPSKEYSEHVTILLDLSRQLFRAARKLE